MKSLGMTERVLRVVLGALPLWALSLFLGGDILVWRLVDVALIVLGLDFCQRGFPRRGSAGRL